MPADQQGSIYKTNGGYGIRWYDEAGTRRRKAGFSSRSASRAWFRDVETPRMRGEKPTAPSPLTLAEFSSRYLERYAADRSPATVRSLQWRLVRPLREFGDVRLTELRTGELAAWEASLPPRFRHDVVRALRMVLDAAVAWQHLERNPAKATGKNPSPPVVERAVLEPGDVERLACEMTHPYDVAIIVGAWCYLRPAELLALRTRRRRRRRPERARHEDGPLPPYRPPAATSERGARDAPPSARLPAPVPKPAGGLLRRLQLAPTRVQLGQGRGRAP